MADLEALTETAARIAEQTPDLEVEDTFPERPRPSRMVRLRTDVRGCRGGVKEALWMQTGQYAGTVRVGIPGAEGFRETTVPIDMVREALDEIESFDPDGEE